MESPSALGTKPQAAFPLTLIVVSINQALCGLRVKLHDAELKFSVKETRFCEKPNGIMNNTVIKNNKSFLITNNLINN